MGPLPMTKRGHWFTVVATYYLTKFAEVCALKSLVKQEITRFLYERIFTQFGTPFEIVSHNDPQFLSEVVENLLARLAVKHRFTTMYKLSTNGLIERTNRTLCSMLAKEAEVHVNICDWELKIHHVVWVYNTTYKTATWYSPFHLTYRMERFYLLSWKWWLYALPQWWNFLWMSPNAIDCCNLTSWTNCSWKPTNPFKLHKLNKRRLLTRRWKKRNSEKVTLSWCLTFDIIAGLIRNCYPSGLDLLLSRRCLQIMDLMTLKMLMVRHI